MPLPYRLLLCTNEQVSVRFLLEKVSEHSKDRYQVPAILVKSVIISFKEHAIKQNKNEALLRSSVNKPFT